MPVDIPQLDTLKQISDPGQPACAILIKVAEVIIAAEKMGFVITVEQRPLQPLVMGNYETVVSIREVRAQS